ncbi:MAG: hypothetical protein HY676_03905 [Chloroflexi bacterium]|nr:hypothetical protein [Chloroflexota bacterium]
MDRKTRHELIQQKQAEDSIRQEFEGTLPLRAARYLQVKPHPIVPYEHFSAASAECSLLFRDGHFYGCIALTQAVAEALVKFLCERNSWKPVKTFEKNVEKLLARNIISDKLKESLLRIWERRDDYHHLNPAVKTVRQELEQLAREKARLLAEVESELFRFVITDGKIILGEPKYWKKSGDQVIVDLRLDP